MEVLNIIGVRNPNSNRALPFYINMTPQKRRALLGLCFFLIFTLISTDTFCWWNLLYSTIYGTVDKKVFFSVVKLLTDIKPILRHENIDTKFLIDTKNI